MTDARILPHTRLLTRPLSAASASEAQSPGDELSDDDLEQIVGGLARTRDGASHGVHVAEASYTIAPVHQIANRVSA